MNIRKTMMLAAVVAGAAITSPAMAGTASATMPVSAIVLENCTVVATPLAFGAMIDTGAANVDSTATLTLACTPNADFYIALNNGSNAAGAQRRLKNTVSAEYLDYNLYMDSARAQPWGSTVGTNTQAGTAPTGAASYTVYGRIPSGVSAVSAGAYADSVTVTVTF